MRTILLLSLLILALTSCKQKEKANPAEDPSTTQIDSLKMGQVNVLTKSMEFFTADTLYSGWNTFMYKNQSPEVHFIMMDLYPEGKTIADTKAELLPPFNDGMKYIMENKMDSAMVAFGKIPEWYQDVQFLGGTGLVSPKHTVKSTFNLVPGRYIMECYVKMFNGEWHTSHGMLKEIIVKEERTDLQPPAPSATVEISSTGGIILRDSLMAGKQTIRTNFLDQKVWEHFVGHDINLVQYDTTASLDSLVQWLNWMEPKGLSTPAPKGFTFLGGMNNIPGGAHGFFEVDLVPGNYVLISEVPEADTKKMMRTFTINP